ncbi:hypothetical protein EDC04DRAFT_2904024 [Pisolithus marmoratus]|nr:hypothetical protein EDC04DRAFT_2904024 [Pisolithus marmoratus]
MAHNWLLVKVTPHSIPELIYSYAGDYGALDFKIMISLAAIEQVQKLYINPNHPVFNLIPPALSTFIKACYLQLGHPFIGCMSLILFILILEANHLQDMDVLDSDKPDIQNKIDATPTLLVMDFSSEEDDKADEEDINSCL